MKTVKTQYKTKVDWPDPSSNICLAFRLFRKIICDFETVTGNVISNIVRLTVKLFDEIINKQAVESLVKFLTILILLEARRSTLNVDIKLG